MSKKDDDNVINVNVTIDNNMPQAPNDALNSVNEKGGRGGKKGGKTRQFKRGKKPEFDRRQSVKKLSGMDDGSDAKNDDGSDALNADAPWMETAFLEMYQEMRKLERDHDVKIAVPEFLFFGFQSAGKTSTLSVVSGIPAGTMKDGTGTRCPVRYTMANNPDLKKDRIWVSGSEVKDYEEQVDRVCDHMRALDSQGKFSHEILECKIESAMVPNMIFVDMPGMLRNDADDKMAAWKKQLEMITCDLLSKISADGVSYAFMPVFVKAAHEPEEQDLVYYIDDLLTSVRPKWKDDALFIVNKFDRLGNMDKGEELCRTLEFLSGHGETVFTITNPFGAATARMDGAQLIEHIQSVPDQESEWWDQMIYDLKRSNDRDVDRLSKFREVLCGCNLMKDVLKRRMIDIVKSTLPFMKQQLELAKVEKEEAISLLQQELQLGDPSKLKEMVQRFNVRYLALLKEFYGSRAHWSLPGARRSWRGDMQDFHTAKHFFSRHAKEWEDASYYIKPKELKKLMIKCGRADLGAQMDMKLSATAALKRGLDYWIAMVSYQNFPNYNDTDIINMSVSFAGSVQSDPWETARNIVFDASIHLRRGTIWFAEYLRYRLKTNADIIFKFAIREFEDSHHYEKKDTERDVDENGEPKNKKKKRDEKMIRLLRIGKADCDKVIDYLIDDFIDTIEKIPNDLTETLDKRFVANAMQYSIALNKLWDYATNYKMAHDERLQFVGQDMAGQRRATRWEPNEQPNQDPQNTSLHGKQGGFVPPPPGGGGGGRDTSNTVDAGQDGKKKKKRKHHGGVDGDGDNNLSVGGGPQFEHIAKPTGSRDTFYYKTLFPVKNEYQFPMYYENDVDLIFNLARVQWASVKFSLIQSVQQLMGHRIMKAMTFQAKDQKFNNAMLRGWDRPQIQDIINDLTKRTNIPLSQFEQIIDKSPIPTVKAVMQMTDDELLGVYGAELKEKAKRLEKMLEEYKDFLHAKTQAESKIEDINTIEFD